MFNPRQPVGDRRCLSYFRRICGLALMITTMIACTGCGNPSAEAAAQQILAHVQSLHITDTTLNLAITITDQGKSESVSGSMKFSQNPPRFDATLTTIVDGAQHVVEEIGDVSASVVYAKDITQPAGATGKWSKLTASAFSFTYGDVFVFDFLTDAQLVDTEELDGIAVWRIHGDIAGENVATNADLFVRKDTYYPVKANITESGSIPSKMTLVYTAFNTGVSIELPSADQLQ